jgi:glutathione S-transferase
MLKIYGRANSINVRKVLWVVEEIGIPYTREDWGRGYRPTSDPEFVKISPFGVVPVIDDDGLILRESNSIVRYLAAKHARSDLYPTDPAARAKVEAWMDWGSTDLYSGVRPVFHSVVTKLPAYRDPKVLEAGIKEWSAHMHRLDEQLSTAGPYLMGRDFTLGDVPAGLIVNRWFQTPFEKPTLKAVSAYYDRLGERPAYQAHGHNGMP